MKCYALVHSQRGGGDDVGYISQFRGWIPTKDCMTASGVQTHGYWPDLSDAAAVIASVFKANVPILFGGPKTPTNIFELNAATSVIPACSAEQRALVLRSMNH